MKKQLTQFVPILFLFLLPLAAIAQSEADQSLASIDGSFEYSDILKLDIKNKSNLKKVSIPILYEAIEIDDSMFPYKVSSNFGSYVIPNTNYLRIVSSDGKNYTNAQLINKQSKKNIFSIPLTTKRNVVDMSYTKAGVYSLILTNEKGEKYTEDIMIM